MDVPDLVRQAVGDEELRAGVNLGDEDAVVFTPTRALVYRGEGLLSDEDVAEYGFDFERLAVSEGRRKTKYTMTYVEGERSFTVPGKRTDDVLENLIEGMLRVAGAIDAEESVTGVFRFSEMTLVVAERRLLKHIGEYTWDADFEAFPYDDLTQLTFEEGSVATQVVLGVGNRSERIKAPNAEAGLVRKTLQQAVFSYHDVGSLEELNREVAVESEEVGETDATGGLGLDSGIDPLVSDDAGEEESFDPATEETAPSRSSTSADSSTDASSADAASGASGTAPESSGAAQGSSGAAEQGSAAESSSQQPPSQGRSSQESASRGSGSQEPPAGQRSSQGSAGQSSGSGRSGGRDGSSGQAAAPGDDDPVSVPSVEGNDEEVLAQLADLTQAVERQNELLHRQQRTVKQLIEELRKGR